MKKYITKNWSNIIEVIEIERETEKSIWIDGKKRSKINDYESFFDTFWQAAEYLIEKQEKTINAAENNLLRQKVGMQDLKDYIKKEKSIKQ